ncbi:MAG: DUF4278 domain-containing protein [Leptolyngbyaceae cyanobacterium MO_188.B28]|nr:DUF4278 domain-containing protein [Leptolyngbyaceae cyanobacterium MO_188.B28]
MKLIHLGASYTLSTHTIETVETDTELQFMGRRFKMRVQKDTPSKFPSGCLTYRGVSYRA